MCLGCCWCCTLRFVLIVVDVVGRCCRFVSVRSLCVLFVVVFVVGVC